MQNARSDLGETPRRSGLIVLLLVALLTVSACQSAGSSSEEGSGYKHPPDRSFDRSSCCRP
jgi:hypothetical protein